MEDPSAIDMDATTSASVTLSGNVGLMAQWIAEETGGDRFSILTKRPYSSDYDECLNQAIEDMTPGSAPPSRAMWTTWRIMTSYFWGC